MGDNSVLTQFSVHLDVIFMFWSRLYSIVNPVGLTNDKLSWYWLQKYTLIFPRFVFLLLLTCHNRQYHPVRFETHLSRPWWKPFHLRPKNKNKTCSNFSISMLFSSIFIAWFSKCVNSYQTKSPTSYFDSIFEWKHCIVGRFSAWGENYFRSTDNGR